MLILGIETATEQVSVAIGGHEGVISTFEVARGRRHAEILAPAIQFMCRQADIELCEFGCIAVDVGPGLFTGMRVGLASGKALAQALRIPMIGISSLDLLAFPHRHTDRVVVPVIDARKGEVFWAMYRQVPGGVQQVAAPTVGPVDELVGRPAGAQPGGAVRRRRGDPLPRRDPRRLPLRVRQLGPSVGGTAGAARPRPRAPRGVGEPSRDRADLPAPPRRPDQLGDAGVAAVSVLARLLQRADDDEPIVIEEMRRKHLTQMLPIEQDAYPKPWSRSVFESELEQVRGGSRHYVVARRRRTVIGYAGLWIVTGSGRRPGPHHQHRGRRRPPAPRRGDPPARVARRRGDRARLHRVDARGPGVEHRRPGAVPPVRVRAGRGPQAVLREHRGCDRDVVSRHPVRRLRPTGCASWVS